MKCKGKKYDDYPTPMFRLQMLEAMRNGHIRK